MGLWENAEAGSVRRMGVGKGGAGMLSRSG